MRKPSGRMLKVNSTMREVLAEEIEKMSDKRLDMVSVTAVDTSPNLRHAVVYIDALDEGAREPALTALDRAAIRLQSAIGRQVRLKYTPTLEFALDLGVIGGERIDEILSGLNGSEQE